MKNKGTVVLRELDLHGARDYILSMSPETKVYVGGDSERLKRGDVWYADYTVVIAVHIDGCHGAHIFGEVTRERDYDQHQDRPALRLMNEVYKIAELYGRLQESLTDPESGEFLWHKDNFEVHLDINKKKSEGSSCVVNEAVGYIRGVCNIEPLIKPNAFAASFAADRGIGLLDQQRKAVGE